MADYTEGFQTGILSSNLLLAEIPPVGIQAAQQPALWMSASVAATIEFQHRNAANTSNLWAHRFFLSAASPIILPAPVYRILEADERIRVMLISSIIGGVQATLFA